MKNLNISSKNSIIMNKSIQIIILILFLFPLSNCSKKVTKTFTEIMCNDKNWKVIETETKINKTDNSIISKKITNTFQIKFHSNNTATMLQSTWSITQHKWFENDLILVFGDDKNIISKEFTISDKTNEVNQIWKIEPFTGTTTINTNIEWNLTN